MSDYQLGPELKKNPYIYINIIYVVICMFSNSMASVSILGVTVVYGLGVLLFSFFVWLVGCFSVCVVSVYFIVF